MHSLGDDASPRGIAFARGTPPALLTFIGAANPRISVSDFPRKSRETNDGKNRSLVNEAPRIAIIQPRVRQSGYTLTPLSSLSLPFFLSLYFTINTSRRRGTRLNIYCNYSANCPESSPRGKPHEIRAIDYREEHVKCYPVNGAVLISPGANENETNLITKENSRNLERRQTTVTRVSLSTIALDDCQFTRRFLILSTLLSSEVENYFTLVVTDYAFFSRFV